MNLENVMTEIFPQECENSTAMKEYFLDHYQDWEMYQESMSDIARWTDLPAELLIKESNYEHVIGMLKIFNKLENEFPDIFTTEISFEIKVMIILHDIGEINEYQDIPTGIKHSNDKNALNIYLNEIAQQKDPTKKFKHRTKEKCEALLARYERRTEHTVISKITDEETRLTLKNILKKYNDHKSFSAHSVKTIDLIQSQRKFHKNLDRTQTSAPNAVIKNTREIQIPNLVKKGLSNLNKHPQLQQRIIQNYLDTLSIEKKWHPELVENLQLQFLTLVEKNLKIKLEQKNPNTAA